MSAATTTLSSKGQVVIPEEIRERLGLRAGARFVVVAEKGVVIFKVWSPRRSRGSRRCWLGPDRREGGRTHAA